MITEDVSTLPSFERYRRAFAALGRVLADPTRTDEVLEFSTYINASAKSDRLDAFFQDPDGQRLYAERRAIDSRIDLDALAALPAGTLGHAYAHFLRSRGLTPDIFDGAPEGVTDSKVAYVIQRLRQTHDLWHVVTGYDTDTASEIALQGFTYGHLGAPSSLVLAAAGTLKGVRHHHALPREVLAGYRAGQRANRLATFPWEAHWATSLVAVRRMLNITAVTYAAAVARSAA